MTKWLHLAGTSVCVIVTVTLNSRLEPRVGLGLNL